MNSHTPGPWKWAERNNGKDVFLVHPAHGWLTVMDFVRRGMQGGTCRFAVWKGDERENMGGIMKPAHEVDVTAHPDARLMASAPDLLAACEVMLAELEREYGNACRNGYFPAVLPVLEQGRAAVARAKGATP